MSKRRLAQSGRRWHVRTILAELSTMPRKRTPRKPHTDAMADLPVFCDYSCPYANFAPVETSGACRREQSVWCALFKKYNNKHNKCLGRMG